MINLVVENAVNFYKRLDKKNNPSIQVKTHVGGGAEFWLVYVDGKKVFSLFPSNEKVSIIFWLEKFSCRYTFYQNVKEVHDKISFLLACHIYIYKHVLPILIGFHDLVYSISYQYYTSAKDTFYVEVSVWDKKDDWLLFLDFDCCSGCIHYNFVYQDALAGIWTPQARSKVYTYLKSVLFSRI